MYVLPWTLQACIFHHVQYPDYHWLFLSVPTPCLQHSIYVSNNSDFQTTPVLSKSLFLDVTLKIFPLLNAALPHVHLCGEYWRSDFPATLKYMSSSRRTLVYSRWRFQRWSLENARFVTVHFHSLKYALVERSIKNIQLSNLSAPSNKSRSCLESFQYMQTHLTNVPRFDIFSKFQNFPEAYLWLTFCRHSLIMDLLHSLAGLSWCFLSMKTSNQR